MMYVNIINGTHRGQTVNGIFPVVKEYNGKFVTVKTDATEPFQVENARVNCNEAEFVYCLANGTPVDPSTVETKSNVTAHTHYEEAFLASESEEDAMNRIKHTFDMLNEVTDAAAQGIIRGLVVSGPPGIGKSFGVEQTLKEANLVKVLKGMDPDYEVVKGASSAIGVYKTLYNFRGKGQVVVFDDCDGILYDDIALNLLKAALDSGDKRRLCWRAESRVLKQEDIPDAFDFEGSVLFLSNIDFERTKASKIKSHLDAIMSRCHYLDLEITSQRDQLLRIKQVVRDGMLNDYEFRNGEAEMIVDYVYENADYLRELSLRMVKKIASIVAMKHGKGWEEFVEATCLKREAKFKRLLDKQAR